MQRADTALTDEYPSGGRVDDRGAPPYPQRRVLARSERRRTGPKPGRRPLVNEVYLELADAGRRRCGEPRRLFAYAAQAMRHMLLDRARLQMRLERGDGRLCVSPTGPDVESVSADANDAAAPDSAPTARIRLDALTPRASPPCGRHCRETRGS